MPPQPMKFKIFNNRHLDTIPQLQKFSTDEIEAMKAVSHVLPFRTNNYVIEQLIDWEKAPEDPIFRLMFPHKDMLKKKDFERLSKAIADNVEKDELDKIVGEIRLALNPHPSGQLSDNIPKFNGQPVDGLQHKYQETALLFPSAGQTCHAYCSFCFRWPQFIGDKELKLVANDRTLYQSYIAEHKEITDLLLTGGDPLTMSAAKLDEFISPFLTEEFSHINTIRIGSKALSFWPYRFLTDKDSDDLLKVFEKVVASGKSLALMSHINHYQEMKTDAFKQAVKRIQETGAIIRSQSPLIRHINDDPKVWQKMWQDQVNLGIIPYYMFVQRDTGAKAYFELPLASAFDIYKEAYRRVSGLARTARGPSMSAHPGKIAIEGVETIAGEKVILLKFLQARNPEWCNKIFYAKYDDDAYWLNDLEPAFNEEQFFYEKKPSDASDLSKAPFVDNNSNMLHS